MPRVVFLPAGTFRWSCDRKTLPLPPTSRKHFVHGRDLILPEYAARELAAMGYTNVAHYPEGKQGWMEAGDSL